MKEIFIVAAKRTPIGGFLGSLSGVSAVALGHTAITAALLEASIDPKSIDSVYMGNVLSADLGQSPARQAAIFAGIPETADCTAINKVCASGMKAVVLAAQQIELGIDHIVVAGGMESMSNVPHYSHYRKSSKMGNIQLTDGLLKDGLTDVYHNYHMGNAAELCASAYELSREEQDEFAVESYRKAVQAWSDGKFTREIAPVTVTNKTVQVFISEDEDIHKLQIDKISLLQPVFEKGGTITAANASNLNDGASALVLVSREVLEKYNLVPLAKIVGYADAAQAPEWFTTSPSVAIPKALARAGLQLTDIDYFEINEAYAAVILANQKILGIEPKRINIYGGGVALGHPIGSSGARIITTLVSVLKQEGGRFGVAAICNGGGGATAVVIESMN